MFRSEDYGGILRAEGDRMLTFDALLKVLAFDRAYNDVGSHRFGQPTGAPQTRPKRKEETDGKWKQGQEIRSDEQAWAHGVASAQ